MGTATNISVLAFILLLTTGIIFISYYYGKYEMKTRKKLKQTLDSKGIKYTKEEYEDAVNSIVKGRPISEKPSVVSDVDDAADYTSYALGAKSTGILRPGALKLICLILLIGCIVSFLFIPKNYMYYGYIVGSAMCILLLLCLNPSMQGYKVIVILFIIGAIVLFLLGLREILQLKVLEDGDRIEV